MKRYHFAVLALGLIYLSLAGCDRRAGMGPAAPEALNPPQFAPELIAPYNGMPGNRLSLVFRWEDVPEPDHYHIQIARDSLFSQLVYEEAGITGNITGMAGLDQFSTYFWRVRALNLEGVGPWSPIWSFATGDGSSPGTIEGTWELVEGWSHGSSGIESMTIIIEFWGEVVVSFGEGTYDLTGVRWIHRSDWLDGDWTLFYDTTYSDTITEIGSYCFNDSSITIALDAFWESSMIQWETRGFFIANDILHIAFTPTTIYGLELRFRRL